MTILAVGLSYRSAPVAVLERAAVGGSDLVKLLDELSASDSISEVLVLSTCNRVEVYADVSRFHPALADVTAVLGRVTGIDVTVLADHLYVHFAEAAVEHLFSVAAGLDSMVVGESQILGQLRSAYAVGTDAGTVGRTLHELVQHALRTGKSVHAGTGIDSAGASVVSVALDEAHSLLGTLAGLRVLIVGAGSMGALAAATVRRRGATDLVITSRTPASAQRIAAAVDGRAISFDDAAALRVEISAADILISCTGAVATVLHADDVEPRDGHPLVVLDLALPHDVDHAVRALRDVHYLDLDALRAAGAMASDADVEAANGLVAAQLRRYLDEQHALAVAPTVTALRARATAVIDAELQRLDTRLPELDAGARAEVAQAVRRAVEKVLHAPTVRVKELAATPDGDRYAAALRALFDLDPAKAETVVAVKSALESTVLDRAVLDGGSLDGGSLDGGSLDGGLLDVRPDVRPVLGRDGR